MRAHAVVRTALRDGRTVLAELRSDPPICLRPTPGGVYWVGGAAGPLGGDELRLDVEVAAGTTLTMRSAAAAILLCGSGGASLLRVRARVGEGAELRWEPEPVISATGSVHRGQVELEVADGAAVLWREEVVLGRTGEPGGDYRSRVRADRDGRPLLRHELCAGQEWADSPAVLDGAGAVGTVLVCGPAAAWAAAAPAEGAALLRLDEHAVLATATAPDVLELRRRLDRMLLPAAVG